jgi:hypothetical protein
VQRPLQAPPPLVAGEVVAELEQPPQRRPAGRRDVTRAPRRRRDVGVARGGEPRVLGGHLLVLALEREGALERGCYPPLHLGAGCGGARGGPRAAGRLLSTVGGREAEQLGCVAGVDGQGRG